MSNLSAPQLVYSLDGLPLSPMGLTPISTERLHRLGIYTLDQLASIALISLAAERNAINDMLERELRARLSPAIVYCYTLLAEYEGEQPQFVIESELFHFVASVVSPEESKYTCSYKWLQTGFEENIPFHRLKRQPKSMSDNGAQHQALLATKQQPQTAMTPLETKKDPIRILGIQGHDIEVPAPPPVASPTSSDQQTYLQTASNLESHSATVDMPIARLKLSNRTRIMLRRWNIHTVGQLTAKSEKDLLAIRNFGVTSLQEVRTALLNLSDESLTERTLPPKIESTNSRKRELLIDELPELYRVLSEIQDFPIRFLNLSNRTANALYRSNTYTLGELVLLGKLELFNIPNMGEKTINEIWAVLRDVSIDQVYEILADLREQGRTPMNLSLPALGLPTLERRLSALGIDNLADICHYATNELEELGLQPSEVSSIMAMLRAYGLKLSDFSSIADLVPVQLPEEGQNNLQGKTAQQHTSASVPDNLADTSIIGEQLISVTDVIHSIMAHVDLREANVLRLRYGLEGQPTCTLEEIGQKIGVTRERVRQIEKRAINQLQRPHHHRVIKPVILILEHALRNANGVISLQTAREILSSQIDGNTIISDGQLAFILLFARHIQPVKDLSMVSLNCEPYAAYIPEIQYMCLTIKSIVAKAFAPLTLNDVIAKFVSGRNEKNADLHIPRDFIIACLKAHPDIVVDEDGTCGLKQWANRRLDDIILVLRQQGKPMHFSEIAERVNERLPSEQRATIHNVHAQIGRSPHIFVRVGRGLFGLAEWGLIQENSSADTAYRILLETGHALDLEELTDRVLATWQVQRTSVRAGIDLDARFVQISRGRYWLAETVSADLDTSPADDFDTLFGDVLLRRREELERDRETSNQHDTLEDVRRLGTAIFG